LDAWIGTALCLALCALALGLSTSIEIALLGLPERRVRHAVESGQAGARALLGVVQAPLGHHLALRMLRIGAAVGAGVCAGLLVPTLQLATDSPLPAAAIGVALATSLLLAVAASLVPRSLAKRHALRWALATVYPLWAITALMTPFIWPFWLLLRLGSSSAHPFWTAEEIAEVFSRTRTETLGSQSEQLLDSMIEFSDTVIREIMVPRTEMIALPVDCNTHDVQGAVVERGHSRIPIYEDTIDNVLGLLHVKDLFKLMTANGGANGGEMLDIRGQLRATFYVPEVMKITELLKEFQRRKTHMAIVVDEYGGTAGVVTLEDIIEEIVGEIQDEYDVEEKQFRVIGEHKVIADGRVQVYDLEEVLKVRFPQESDFETLAGFLTCEIGYLPEAGATVEWGGLRFTIKEANEKRIATVEIERFGAGPEASGHGAV